MNSEYLSKAIKVNNKFDIMVKECEKTNLNQEMYLEDFCIKDFLKIIGGMDFEDTISHRIKNKNMFFKIAWNIKSDKFDYGFFSMSSDYDYHDPLYYTMDMIYSEKEEISLDDMTALQQHVAEMDMEFNINKYMNDFIKVSYPTCYSTSRLVKELINLKPHTRYFTKLGTENVSLYIHDLWVAIE